MPARATALTGATTVAACSQSYNGSAMGLTIWRGLRSRDVVKLTPVDEFTLSTHSGHKQKNRYGCESVWAPVSGHSPAEFAFNPELYIGP